MAVAIDHETRGGGDAWRQAHLIHASPGSHRGIVNSTISPDEYTDRHTSTLGPLDTAMAKAPRVERQRSDTAEGATAYQTVTRQ